jgi:hypothetical protein
MPPRRPAARSHRGGAPPPGAQPADASREEENRLAIWLDEMLLEWATDRLPADLVSRLMATLAPFGDLRTNATERILAEVQVLHALQAAPGWEALERNMQMQLPTVED